MAAIMAGVTIFLDYKCQKYLLWLVAVYATYIGAVLVA